MKLEDWRKEIDSIDLEIIRLINQRGIIVKKIGTLKAKAGLPIVDKKREAEILQTAQQNNQGILRDNSILQIYKKIIEESRQIQIECMKPIKKAGMGVY